MGQGMCLHGYSLESRALYMGSQILNSPGWGETKALAVTDVMGVVGVWRGFFQVSGALMSRGVARNVLPGTMA